MTHSAEKPELIKGNIYLTGYMEMGDAPGQEIMDAAQTHIDLTRAEPGCLYFVMAQDAKLPNRLNVEEIFEDKAAFEHHKHRVATSEWAEIAKGIERHFTIREI